jgi:hypothetical protein
MSASAIIKNRIHLHKMLWEEFHLSDLSTYRVTEHDASLFHFDSHLGRDPHDIDVNAVEELIKLSKDGKVMHYR